ncbi:hypothetical protein AVEN_106087-1 [Araneus ventricosus]|uniref:Uncharacterized protein n=1 Tax=Araneus ventricosus TaxID=182803 RepID=A0A4Y2SST3_ARAVE|nr:hypothetical protein AVEN_106087-1 [Araneus ventricosus]
MEIGVVELEFQRTQNPTLHAPIPTWGVDARVAAHQRIYLDWDLATGLVNRISAVWGSSPTADFRLLAPSRGPNLGRSLMCRYPRIDAPSWNRRMKCWILSSLNSSFAYATISIGFKLTIVFFSFCSKIPFGRM